MLRPRPLEIPGGFLRVCVLAWRRRRPVSRAQRHEQTHARFLLATLAALMIVPAPAGAAPWAEQPFVALGPDVGADCLAATGRGPRRRTSARSRGSGTPRACCASRPTARSSPMAASRSHRCSSARPWPPRRPARRSPPRAPFAPGRRGLVVATRDPGGEFGAPQAIRAPRTTGVGEIHAAVAADGAAVVVWNETRARGDRTISRLLASRRPPGGAFGPAQTLLSGARGRPVAGRGHRRRGSRDRRVAAAAPERVERGRRGRRGGGRALRPAADGDPHGGLRGSARPRGRAGRRRAARARREPAASACSNARRARPRCPASRSARPTATTSIRPSRWPPAARRSSPGAADALDERKARLVVARRAPGAAFAAPQDVGAGVPRGGPARPSFTPVEDFEAIAAAAAADGSVHVAWLEAPRLAGGDEPARVAVASAAAGGDWSEAARLGGPGRSASALAVLAAPAAVGVDGQHRRRRLAVRRRARGARPRRAPRRRRAAPAAGARAHAARGAAAVRALPRPGRGHRALRGGLRPARRGRARAGDPRPAGGRDRPARRRRRRPPRAASRGLGQRVAAAAAGRCA